MTRPVIRLKAGDDKTVRVAVQNSDGSARDLTDETIEFRAAPSLSASALMLSKVDGDGVEVVDPPTMGLVDVVFSPDDTADLPGFLLWEIRVTDVAGIVITLDFNDDASEPWTYGVLKVERSLLATG